MTEMPNNLGELDEMIAFDMLDAALAAVTAAERWARDRAKDPPQPDPDTFPRWSEASEPGTLDYGPFTPPPV